MVRKNRETTCSPDRLEYVGFDRVKRFFILTILLGLLEFLSSGVIGQTKTEGLNALFLDTSSSVAAGTTVGGIKYYIKIVSIDTIREEHMPRYDLSKAAEFVTVDHQPLPLRQVRPEYPEKARRSGIEGTVWINCFVGEDGRVRKANVMRADAEILVKPSTAAALQWQFSPAPLRGKPVGMWAAIPFRVTLSNGKQ